MTVEEFKEKMQELMRRELNPDWGLIIEKRGKLNPEAVLHTKMIYFSSNPHFLNTTFMLHEIAHAKTEHGHDGVWGDCYTELVYKYLENQTQGKKGGK